MQRLPDDITNRDIYQWLDGGVVLARRASGWEPAIFIGVQDEDGSLIAARFLDEDDVRTVRKHRIRTHWPECGAVNGPHCAWIVARQQRRQWRRTYTGRSVSVNVVGRWAGMAAGFNNLKRPAASSDEVSKAVFNPDYPANAEELNKRLSERYSVAINKFLVAARADGTTRLYYRGNDIGTLSEDMRLSCDNPGTGPSKRAELLLKEFADAG